MSQIKKKFLHINSLTSLRFFAALGVMLHHLGILNSVHSPVINRMASYFFNGYVGVTFFYILSGFIINYSFNKHLQDGQFDIKDFFVFRVFRLFPVHVLTLFSFLVLTGTFSNLTTEFFPFISNLFLIHALIPEQQYYFAFNSVSWSISCELMFYISFCGLITLSNKALVVVLSLILSCQFYLLIFPQSLLSDHWLFYINPFFRIVDFMIGVLVCRVYFATNYMPGKLLASIFEISSVIFLLLMVVVATKYIDNMNVRYDLFFIPPMLAILCAFLFNNGILSRLLSYRLFIRLGEASFAFYMIHLIIITQMVEVLNPKINKVSSVLFYSLSCFVLSLLISLAIYYFYESPINKILRRKWIAFRYGQRNELISSESEIK